MKKSRKVWLGIATIWPIVYIFFFVVSIFSLVLFAGGPSGPGSQPPNSALLSIGFMALFAVHIVTILGTLALTVFYIIRVFKTERLDQNMKIMWMLLLFFMGIIVQPIFWYLYIWRDQPKLSTAGAPRSALGAASPSWTGQTTAPREAAYVPPSQPPDWR
jgi:hypothetical protein